MKNRFALALPLLLALAAAPVAASEPHVHDHAKDHQPRHGGVMTLIGHQDWELVAKPERLVIYVSDHGQPTATAGATGKLTLLTGKTKTEAVLKPTGKNALEAAGPFQLGAGSKVLATITLAGQKPTAVRFELK